MKLTFEASGRPTATLSPQVVEAFKKAVSDNDTGALARLFMQPGTINCQFEEDQSIRTPLDWTAQHGSQQMLSWLFKLGASLTAANNAPDPLRSAMRGHKSENVKLLLDRGAECGSGESSVLKAPSDPESFQFVFDAIVSRKEQDRHPLVDIAMFRIYSDDEIDIVNILISHITEDSDLNHLLKSAITQDFPEACKLLLQKIKQIDDDNLLVLAISTGKKKVVPVLCESRRIDVNKRSIQKLSAKKSGPEIEASISPLFFAMYLRRYDTAISILQSAADRVEVNEVNQVLGTPLLFALDINHANRNQLLSALMAIEGLDASLRGPDNSLPLHEAMAVRELSVVTFLLSKIDDTVTLCPVDLEKFATPTYSAVLQEFFKHPKADVNTVYGNMTLLNHAVLADNVDLVMRLLARPGTDVNNNLQCMEAKFRSNPSILKAFLLHPSVNILYFNKLNETKALGDQDAQLILAARNLLSVSLEFKDTNANQFIALLAETFNKCPPVIYNFIIPWLERIKTKETSVEEKRQVSVILKALMNLPVNGPAYDELCFTIAQSLSTLPDSVVLESQKELTAIFFLNAKQHNHPTLIKTLADLGNISADPNTVDLWSDPTTRPSMLKALATVNRFQVLALEPRPYMDEEMVKAFYQESEEIVSLMWHITRLYAYSHKIGPESSEEHDVCQIVASYEDFLSRQNDNKWSAADQKPSNVKELARRLSGTFAIDPVDGTQPVAVAEEATRADRSQATEAKL